MFQRKPTFATILLVACLVGLAWPSSSFCQPLAAKPNICADAAAENRRVVAAIADRLVRRSASKTDSRDRRRCGDGRGTAVLAGATQQKAAATVAAAADQAAFLQLWQSIYGPLPAPTPPQPPVPPPAPPSPPTPPTPPPAPTTVRVMVLYYVNCNGQSCLMNLTEGAAGVFVERTARQLPRLLHQARLDQRGRRCRPARVAQQRR